MQAIYFNIDWESTLHNLFETVGGGAKDLVAVSNWLKLTYSAKPSMD